MILEIHGERCSGCRLCQQVCAIGHFRELNPKKSAIRIKAHFPAPGGYLPQVCEQCGECEAVCPAGAIRQELGAFIVDPDECTLCQECISACPSGAIRIPPGEESPFKCDLCLKCTAVCNTGALVATATTTVGKETVRCTDSAERLFA